MFEYGKANICYYLIKKHSVFEDIITGITLSLAHCPSSWDQCVLSGFRQAHFISQLCFLHRAEGDLEYNLVVPGLGKSACGSNSQITVKKE